MKQQQVGKLKKQIQRQQIAKGVNILQRRHKMKQLAMAQLKLNALQRKQDSICTQEKLKEAPKVNYYKQSRRGFTTTLALPSSIVDNAQSLELKTYLVS